MNRQFDEFSRLISSLLIFGCSTLAIAGVAYETFAPDGRISLWVQALWDKNPVAIPILGIALILLQQWMDRKNPGKGASNAIVYLTAMAGGIMGILWLTHR